MEHQHSKNYIMCWTPLSIQPKFTADHRPNVYGERQSVPCGKCPPCIKSKMNGWLFRITQEHNNREKVSAEFITLTYATEHVPISENGELVLNKRDVQLFFKRLRKAQYKSDWREHKVEYFIVGEYGTHTLRPHYHVILFNAKQELIQDAWQKGQVHYDQVNAATITYALKYMMKDIMNQEAESNYQSRIPEFRLMSKGLGACYITPETIAWHKADLLNRMYLNVDDGKKIAMPRYYKERIYTEAERKQISKHHQDKLEQQYIDKWNEEHVDEHTPEWKIQEIWKKAYNEIQSDAYQFTKFKNSANKNRDKI